MLQTNIWEGLGLNLNPSTKKTEGFFCNYRTSKCGALLEDIPDA